MTHCSTSVLPLLIFTWIQGAPFLCASARLSEMVRQDWFFRESLVAIRDWERILAHGYPELGASPVFPVPADGRRVDWPNPIPRTLIPAEDRERRVRLRFDRGEVNVTHLDPAGSTRQVSVTPGDSVLGYKHPGGGGKDHWYHSYNRRFDRLTKFRPAPAPFSVELEEPWDFRRGTNEFAVALRPAGDEPLTLDVRLCFHSPEGKRECGTRTVRAVTGGKTVLKFPVVLSTEGGGLLLLVIRGPELSFSIPLFTHVEDTTAILRGIEKILSDTPSVPAAERLSKLRGRTEKLASTESPGAGWRVLFEEVSALRDELLLERIDFDSLLFVKRKPFDSEQPFMDAHHLLNRPGGGIFRLSPVRPWGEVRPILEDLGDGIYRDLCLHWDAKRLLFSFGNGSDQWDGKQSYHIHEIGVDGSGLRQLTFGPKNDCEPFYLSNGQIGFTSDRSEHFVMCGGNRHSPNLFVMEKDGSAVRQLSFNVFNDFNPTMLPDGRVLYSRWEYNERSVTSLHNPFTVHPDGTMMAPFYGNATIRPNVVMFPRPVPRSDKILALFTAHHGQTHGAIGLIDVKRGIDGRRPITVLTPGVPVTGEKAEDSAHGWYSDPVPLTESTYLCSFTPTVVPWLERSWALYVGDRHGNLALVLRDQRISTAEPVPLVSRRRPSVLPTAPRETDATDAEASLLVLDVYDGLPGVPRGTARYLRILEDVPRKSVRKGGVICTSGTRIYTIKRILGTVPIHPDGSAHFVVPANRNVYFEVLDESRREIQRMRSVVCLKPGEKRTCIGCHEPWSSAPPNRSVRAPYVPASRATPPPWGTRTLSFLRDVQPVLNGHCVPCHTHDRTTCRVILTDDLTDQFTVGYEELLAYLSVADAMRWDHPDDVYPRPPYTYGSGVSPLVKLIETGHGELQLSEEDRQRLFNWVDANGVYYDRYETHHYSNRRIFTGKVREAMTEVYARRCASCHGENDGRHSTWWLSVNRRDVKMSRALQAPLSRSAGGWERCDGPVFANIEDPDYRLLLASLTTLGECLAQRPRADLSSIHGAEAERQEVRLPPPPPKSQHREPERSQGWVHLGRLSWSAARAGWSPNGDGLPRVDRDIENKPLRLGLRRYQNGIGTHAPSEIAYRLDGKYTRFVASVGGAEAGGTVVFQVWGDGELLYESGVLHGLRTVKRVDLSVAGRRELRLVVTDAGDGHNCDMANWADPRILKKSPLDESP